MFVVIEMTEFAVVIPSRYASQRLPGKPLIDIRGKPMIQHVYERACASAAVDVVIATDDERIAEAAESFGAKVCMTSANHQSGTERIAEVADIMDWPDQQVVVNLQGDEPTMPPQLIDQCAALLDDASADIATLASPFLSQADFENPNCVKVVRDSAGHAIYFSRATIPYPRDGDRDEGEQAEREQPANSVRRGRAGMVGVCRCRHGGLRGLGWRRAAGGTLAPLRHRSVPAARVCEDL